MAPLQGKTFLFGPENNEFCLFIGVQRLAQRSAKAFRGLRLNRRMTSRRQTVKEQDSKPSAQPEKNDGQISPLPAYEPPRLTVMDENQVMSVFQVPVVAGSWWG